MKISEFFKNNQKKIEYLDLELIISHVTKKTREFILAHPEYKISKAKKTKLEELLKRRIKSEPIAFILGLKEFYGLPFKVNKHTLIPRPETELLVEKVLELNPKTKNIIDIGTGSGNIIISLAKNIKEKNYFYGTDISPKALGIARQNAKLNKVEKKIKFVNGNLLDKFEKNILENSIIIANLPYLSKEIYSNSMPDVIKFEPRSALCSQKNGLAHYRKLFSTIKFPATILIEFSPEQKPLFQKIIRQEFPKATFTFYKDLAQKWRALKINVK